ncbi:MAG: hypothetical protein KDA17_00050 [Candidatus Saccharibacteria bacterium]|nr:hypothetical protein [Candidatus Saccharibacteria bacterium]
MLTYNKGLATVVNNQPGQFFDKAVETTRRQRARKEDALAESRKLLVEKQAFAPFAPVVNQFMEDEINRLANSMDVDAGYSQAVRQYADYYSQSKQVEKFMTEAASAYQADKEVNHQVATKAMYDRFIQTGSLDELSELASTGMDAEDVLLKTPGALKADVVLEDRLNRFGDIVLQYASQDKKAKSIGGGNMVVEGSDIMKKYKQFIKKDGENIYVDPAALDDKGFFDVLISDKRVNSIVEAQLKADGVEELPPTADVAAKKEYMAKKRDKLAQIMTPYVDYSEVSKADNRYMSNMYARVSASTSKETDSDKKKRESLERFNDWYKDFMSGVDEAASYLGGATIPSGGLITKNSMLPQVFDTHPEVMVRSVKYYTSGSGKRFVRMNLVDPKGKPFNVADEQDSQESDVVIPIDDFMNSEEAAMMYEQARSTKSGVHYKESKGIAAPSSGPKTLGGINLMDIGK